MTVRSSAGYFLTRQIAKDKGVNIDIPKRADCKDRADFLDRCFTNVCKKTVLDSKYKSEYLKDEIGERKEHQNWTNASQRLETALKGLKKGIIE